MIALLAIKGSDCSESERISDATSVEYVLDIHHSATLTESEITPKYNTQLPSNKLFSRKTNLNNNLKAYYSNSKTKLLFRISKERFSEIKPLFIQTNVFTIQSSVSNNDTPPIS